MEINEIALFDTLPKVFENESIPASDVWRKNVKFTRGKNYIIEAASGTGKSSLCSYIFGSRRDYSGKIMFDNSDIASLNRSQWQQIRRTSIAYLPQELALFPELTALQNIQLKNRLTSHIDNARIEEWLHCLGIDSRTHYPVGHMSVGQQQRVAIIRALCQPFSFILIDEPVSHLDEANNRIAAEIIMNEARRQNAAIIATSVGNNIKITTDHILKL